MLGRPYLGGHPASPYLEAEEADGADDEILPGSAGGRQDSRQVVDAQCEEEEEAEQVAPDVDGLVGEDEEAVRRQGRGEGGGAGVSRGRCGGVALTS